MNVDIVEELRDTDDLGSSGTDFEYMVDLLHRAADEIERLRLLTELQRREPV